MPDSSFAVAAAAKKAFVKCDNNIPNNRRNKEVGLMLGISNQPFSACYSVMKSPVSDDFRPN